MKYIVYKTTCQVNGKCYIGKHQTENPDIFDGYLGNSIWVNRTDRLKNPEFPFHFAVKKYGIENFKRETLFVFDTAEEAFTKEAELVNEDFIKKDDNYNVVLGGKGGKQLPKPVYQFDFQGNLINEYHYGMIQASKIVGISWTCIQDAINRKHQSANYLWSYSNSINIDEYILPRLYYIYSSSGEFIKECKSSKECVEYINCSLTNLYKATNSNNTINGYFITTTRLDKIRVIVTPLTGSLNQYTADGHYITSYATVKEAKEKLNLKLSNISQAIRNNKICCGFRWTRGDNPPDTIQVLSMYHPKKTVQVFDLNGNLIEEFSSARQCEKKYPGFRSVIYGRAKTSHNCIFKYKSS